MDSHVPAATNSQIVTLGDDMDKSFVVETTQQLGRLIGRVVINHYHIILKLGFLAQRTVNGIANGFFAIVNRDNHRCFYIKLLLVKVGTTIERGVDFGTDGSQVGGGSMLHLNLYLTITWVHIVELLFARGTCIGLLLGIKFLVNVEDTALTTQEQAQGINSCILVGMLVALHGKTVQQTGFYQDERAQIEIVADTTNLIIDNRMGLQLAINQVVVVGVDHGSIRIGCDTQHAVECTLGHLNLSRTNLQQGVIGLGMF